MCSGRAGALPPASVQRCTKRFPKAAIRDRADIFDRVGPPHGEAPGHPTTIEGCFAKGRCNGEEARGARCTWRQ